MIKGSDAEPKTSLFWSVIQKGLRTHRSVLETTGFYALCGKIQRREDVMVEPASSIPGHTKPPPNACKRCWYN
jgi:hypothetical protein